MGVVLLPAHDGLFAGDRVVAAGLLAQHVLGWEELAREQVPGRSAIIIILSNNNNNDVIGDLYTESGQTLQGPSSAVSKPKFASKYSLETSRRDLHNALLCTAL